jgi:plastocyanin
MRNNSQRGGAGVWILIVIIIAIGAFFFFKNSAGMVDGAAETTEEVVAPTEIRVTYDANGFSPNTVTIKKGETVIFQNKTGKPASVASGPHPTHTNYPEFDQYKTEQRGQNEFRFVFEKIGTWKYHDHLNANMTGTVIVTE